MPKYNAVEVSMSSGQNGTENIFLKRVQSASWNYTVPRYDSRVLGRFKQLSDRPVINYTPVTYSIEMLKSDNVAEQHLGLTHSSGVGIILGTGGDGNSLLRYAARDFNYLISDPSKLFYENEWNIKTGVLTSYTVNASVGDIARISFGGEGFDLRTTPNNQPRSGVTYTSDIVKNDGISLSGISFSGTAITGISIQSFSIGLSFNRQSFFDFGTRFPRRVLSEANATLQIQGFVEGIASNFVGLSGFNCGGFETGTYYFTLIPSCSPTPGTTYAVVKPYIDSVNFGAQVGNYISVDIGMSIPIGINLSLIHI
mgnify:CR=1 FL=1